MTSGSVEKRTGTGQGIDDWHHGEDEISLFDLWAILIRRKWIIVGITILCVVLSVVYALNRTPVYSHRLTLEIGSRVLNGEVVPIEAPSTVAAKMNQNYLSQALGQWYENHPDAGWAPDLSASVPEQSGIVVLSGQAPRGRDNAIEQLLKAAAQRLQDDHERIFQTVQDDMALEVERARNDLASLQASVEALQSSMARVDERRELLQQEIESLESLVAAAQENRRDAQQQVNRPAEAMTLLMLSNDIRESYGQLADLRSQLRVDLAGERDGLKVALSGTRHAMDAQKQQVEALQTRLENLVRTQPLSAPQRAFKPEGPGTVIIVGLGTVVGLMLGVFAAFFWEFVVRANEHMHSHPPMRHGDGS